MSDLKKRAQWFLTQLEDVDAACKEQGIDDIGTRNTIFLAIKLEDLAIQVQVPRSEVEKVTLEGSR